MMKAPDSIQAIPEVQRTFSIFSSTCRRGEHFEQRGDIVRILIRFTFRLCTNTKMPVERTWSTKAMGSAIPQPETQPDKNY